MKKIENLTDLIPLRDYNLMIENRFCGKYNDYVKSFKHLNYVFVKFLRTKYLVPTTWKNLLIL